MTAPTLVFTPHGRAEEEETLRSAYERAKRGSAELVLITGQSGVGKTLLARGLMERALQEKAIVASGKFDPSSASSYQAVARVLLETTTQVLTWDEALLHVLRERFRSAIGPRSRILTDLTGELRYLLPSAAALPAVLPQEARNRFRLAIADFLRVFGELDHPLVILLDDLQWADSDFLSLWRFLLADPGLKGLLWVGTSRESPDRLQRRLEEAADAKMPALDAGVEALSLVPWAEDDVTAFVAQTLRVSADAVRPLGQLIHSKSHGQQYFCCEMLKRLAADGILEPGQSGKGWRWDGDRIKRMPLAGSVADWIRDRIQRLSEPAQQVLSIAACLGYEFELPTLGDVTGDSPATLGTLLDECLQEELLVSFEARGETADSRVLAFQHDEVRQAVYERTPEAERRQTHLRIGRSLLEKHGGGEVADHLGEAVDVVSDAHERLRIAELCLNAARKAREEAAFSLALRRARSGIRALPADAWQEHYSLTHGLSLLCAECEYLNGDVEASEKQFEELVKGAATDVDRSVAFAARMMLREHSLDHGAAIGIGLEGLRLLGIKLPARPGLMRLVGPLLGILARLRLSSPLSLPVRARSTPPRELSAMRLLSHLWTGAFLANEEKLQGLTVLVMMRISLRVGDCEFSSVAWVCFAVLQSSMMNDPRRGYELGEHALRLADHFPNALLAGRVKFLFAAFLSYHRHPLTKTLELVRQAFASSVQAGDMVYAGYCNDTSAWLLMALGFPLKRVLLEAAELESFARTAGHRATLGNVQILKRWADVLRNKGRKGLSTDLSVASLATDKIDQGFAYLCEWQLALIFKDSELAAKLEKALRGNPILDPGSYFQAELFVYQALTAAAAYPTASASRRRKLRRIMRSSAAKLSKWGSENPGNFGHLQALVKAEFERARGRPLVAGLEYERAIAGARTGGFLQFEALANERAGELCLVLDRPRAAAGYLGGAAQAFQSWGAQAKVDEMRRQYGAAIPAADPELEQESELSSADFLAFIHAARAISGEIRLPQLLSTLARILSGISNAERGLVLFPDRDEFVVAAQWPPAAVPSEGSPTADFPIAIAHFVMRTERMVRLPDPDFEFLFRTEPYLAERRPMSALCFPLIHQGKLLALLYLESGLDRNAFAPGRIQLLELLASQAAISIASARFHALQLEAEQAKINPHFLFNALSSIAELAITQGAQAEEAIVKLANLYRYILTQSVDRLVGLEQELEIVRSYLTLEQMRLGDKLEFSISIEGDTSAVQLPGLLIQPLAENAVKHGVVPKVGPGRVDIRVEVRGEHCSIVVEDDGSGTKSSSSGTGFGLRSVQERLALVYGRAFSFAISQGRGYRVEVEIPAVPHVSADTHSPLRRFG